MTRFFLALFALIVYFFEPSQCVLDLDRALSPVSDLFAESVHSRSKEETVLKVVKCNLEHTACGGATDFCMKECCSLINNNCSPCRAKHCRDAIKAYKNMIANERESVERENADRLYQAKKKKKPSKGGSSYSDSDSDSDSDSQSDEEKKKPKIKRKPVMMCYKQCMKKQLEKKKACHYQSAVAGCIKRLPAHEIKTLEGHNLQEILKFTSLLSTVPVASSVMPLKPAITTSIVSGDIPDGVGSEVASGSGLSSLGGGLGSLSSVGSGGLGSLSSVSGLAGGLSGLGGGGGVSSLASGLGSLGGGAAPAVKASPTVLGLLGDMLG